MAAAVRSIDLLRNAREYITRFLKIRTKDGKLEPLRMNPPQQKLYNAIRAQAQGQRPVRILILKARQMGFSTVTAAVIFHRTAIRELVRSTVVAHQADATANLFGIYRRFYEELPDAIRPMKKASNAQELVFENPTRDPEKKKREPGLRSAVRCATAGGRGIGRSETINNVHMSEFAFWPGRKLDTYTGLMQAVPDQPGTLVIVESTANGFEAFKDLWDDAVAAWEKGERDGFEPVFFAWWEMPEYRRPVPEGFVPTPEEAQIRAAYGLDNEQLVWRRWCIKTNCGGDLDLFHQEYPASPDEAFIASGRCIFDKEAVILQRERVRKRPRRRGRFAYQYDGLHITGIRWTDAWDGELSILEDPETGRPYVIGGDTAGEGSDWFVGQVLDNATGRQVAVLHQESGEGEYVRQLYCLGMWYNTALLGVESNFSTYPNAELRRLGYPRLLVREVPDNYSGRLRDTYGFRTDAITRPLILSELVELAEQHLELIQDYETLGEMLTFVKNERGRAEAQEGKHDDLVMALAIANHIRPRQRMAGTQEQERKSTWTPDQWEDYRAAGAEGRKYLLAKWGEPFAETPRKEM